MRKWILLTVLSFCVSITTSAFAERQHDMVFAKKIIEAWFSAMKEQDVNKAASFLAPQFTSIHTDGMVRDKDQEIKLIKNLDMKSYNLTDFRYRQSGDAIVVTYKDKGDEKIDNSQISPKTAGRLAVLQKQQDQWLILAYANLDAIK